MAETTTSGTSTRNREHEGELSPLGEMIRLVELRRQHQLSETEFLRAKQQLQTTS